MLGSGTLTLKVDSPSFAELAWHVRNRCVHYLITVPFLLANSPGTLANLVVIKARKRYEDMVRATCPLFIMFLREELIFSQVWCRANRDVGLDDPGVCPRSTIRDARLPVLVTGTIQ
jgi:hypothetical protein